MGKAEIIDFNAREYKLDTSCESNVGDRFFVTTDIGTKEVWEIGDWDWNKTQIFCDKKLEKNTDYILRFALSGGYCSTWDSVSRVWLYHKDGFETEKEALEDKMAFPLENDRFAPIISKKESSGLIRVFEIPFNSGDFTDWRIIFVSQHAVARFMAAGENSDYDKLQDQTIKELKNPFATSGMGKILDAIKDLSGAVESEERHPDDETGTSRTKALGDILDALKKLDLSGANNKTFMNRTYNESEFWEVLLRVDNGNKVDFSNVTVNADEVPGRSVVTGPAVSGTTMNFSNIKLTSLAMSAIVAKAGDNCVLNFNSVIVTEDGLSDMVNGGEPKGLVIRISNTTIPEPVLTLIKIKTAGRDCVLETSGIIFN